MINETVAQALQVMAIGLPVMFGVIVLFMVVTKLLVHLFPYKGEEKKE